MSSPAMNTVFQLGNRIALLPVVHGSVDCALAVRRWMLSHTIDCLAVTLPPSYQQAVEQAVQDLPQISAVVPMPAAGLRLWEEIGDTTSASETHPALPYVPIDPCQPVIAAIRGALGERIPRVFIDRESEEYVPHVRPSPDPYAAKQMSLERFAAALLPALHRPEHPAIVARIAHLARQLRVLQDQFHAILCVCGMEDWPWIRAAYCDPAEWNVGLVETDATEVETYAVECKSLLFFLGELPYITALYERARSSLEDDSNMSIDGIKELLRAARRSYQREFKSRARTISPQALGLCLKYMRNLTLLDRRLTPDLYSVVLAAKQVLGDSFAVHVAEQARRYPFPTFPGVHQADWGIGQARLDDTRTVPVVSRLPNRPMTWRKLELSRRPTRREQRRWQVRWNPYSSCSWPPEDTRIENFRTHVVDRAKAIIGSDLARSEKFTSSLKDGLDIRETLRNWHTGEIYVKVLPPTQGELDAVVMLFDSPADPREYPWRMTWYAEHQEESTLAFYATDYRKQMVGPGIGLATYGGALFLFPPRRIPDIWVDPRLDFTESLEERLLAAAGLYAESRQVVLVSPAPPGAGWRRLARKYRKKWVHIPLQSFGQSTLAQLRLVHVLNGRHVRSYAAQFIRKA